MLSRGFLFLYCNKQGYRIKYFQSRPAMKYILGIDWGGTYIKSGLVDDKGKIVSKEVFASTGLKKRDIFVGKLHSLVSALGGKIKAVGIGAPGIINSKDGFIYYLPNVPGWENYPLKKVLRQKLKLPVFIDNDANIFALAEARLGAAKDVERAIFLTLGTGLGGAVILNGKILEGETSASELGHVPIDLKGKRCNCGGRGCIETFVGNKYLLDRYNKLKKQKTRIKEVSHIFKKALTGEREALMVWREFSKALGMFLSGMINVFNPQIIIFGGGVSGAFKVFKPLVTQQIHEQAMWPQVKGLKLVKAKLKDAGIVGAAILAKENL